jgi:hypothetical protein
MKKLLFVFVYIFFATQVYAETEVFKTATGTIKLDLSKIKQIDSTTTPELPPTFCTDGTLSCAPTLLFATTTKKYKIPKEGQRIAPNEANYTVFPQHLNFKATGRNILVISRYWQTGCLYDTDGNIMRANTLTSKLKNKYICMQTATGKKELPTELGLYNIQTKQSKDYKSTKYTTTGEITDEMKENNPEWKKLGAPMSYAMHFGRIIGMGPDQKLWYDFSDGSALHERQTVNKYGSVSYVSHGCLAIEKGKGKYLQSLVTYGDLILVVDQTFPNTLNEAISLNQ